MALSSAMADGVLDHRLLGDVIAGALPKVSPSRQRIAMSAGPPRTAAGENRQNMSVAGNMSATRSTSQKNTRKFPVTPRDLLGRKRAPIWLGASGQREAPVMRVPSVRTSLPDDILEREGDTIQWAEQQEQEAESLEVAKRYVQAAECYEQALAVRRKLAGDHHSHTILAFERVCELVNTWGMRCLAAGQTVAALELLKKAEALTEAEVCPSHAKRRVELRGRTFGNLCCYFRSRGKHNAALQFAEKAIRLERQYSKEGDDNARTRLNYAVLLSAMGQHQEAVQQNEMAVAALRETERSLSSAEGTPMPPALPWRELRTPRTVAATADEVAVSLVVAYHNLWVEHSRLSQWTASNDFLLRAANTARQRLGEQHSLTLKMLQSLETASDIALCLEGDLSPRTQAAMRSPSPPERASSQASSHFFPVAARLPSVAGASPQPGTGGFAPTASPRLAHDPRHKSPPPALPARPHSTMAVRTSPRQSCASPRPHSTMGVHRADAAVRYGHDARDRSLSPSPSPVQHWTANDQIEAAEREMATHAARLSVLDCDGLLPARNGARTASPRLELPLGRRRTKGRQHRGGPVEFRRSTVGDLPPRPSTAADYASLAEEDEEPVQWSATTSTGPPRRLGSSRRCACSGFLDEQGRCRECGVRDAEAFVSKPPLESFAESWGKPQPTPRSVVPTPPVSNTSRGDALRLAAADIGCEKTASERVVARRYEQYAQEAIVVERAALQRQEQRVQQLTSCRSTTPGAGSGGPFDNRRRDAYMIVCSARRDYVETRAALKIQKVWRGCSTRFHVQREIARTAHTTSTQVQSLFRRYRALKWAARRKQAAVIIQTRWRRMHEFINWKTLLRGQRYVTRLVEGYIARHRIALALRSALVFQRLIRGFLTRLRHRRREAGRIKIQKVVRGVVLRIQMQRRIQAANRIGADWRGFVDRRQQRLFHRSATRIQCRYRYVLDKRRVRRRQLASARIGAAWLGYRTRQRNKLESRICIVQARVRGLLARRHVALMEPAARRIQRYWLRRRKVKRFRTRWVIAVMLQKFTRHHKVTRRLALLSKSATGCQRIFRGFFARRELEAKDAVALRIQATWYKAVAKREVKDLQRSASSIQRFIRRLLARWRFRKEVAAADRIRGFWKGIQVRRALARRAAAAAVLQRVYRGHRQRRTLRQRRAAALTIQCGWRDYMRRQRQEARQHAARVLQRAWRQRYHLRRWRMKFRAKMVILQSIWRGKRGARRLQRLKRLALSLQAVCRGRRGRRELARKSKAAESLQCAWRCLVARRRFYKFNKAAETIQRAVLKTIHRRLVKRMVVAASRIQRVMMGALSRRCNHRRASALRLQIWMKGRAARLRFLRKRQAAICLQRYWKCRKAQNQYRTMKDGFAAAVFSAKRLILRHLFLSRRRAGVVIQAAWHRQAVWIRLRRQGAAATTIQRHARRMLANRRLRKKTWVAAKLQALTRRKRPHRRMVRLREAQRRISRLVRCRYAFRLAARKHTAARCIGSTAKMYLRGKRFARETAASVAVQRFVRGTLARRRTRRMVHVAPVPIQLLQRRIRAVKLAETLRHQKALAEQRAGQLREEREQRARESAALRIQAWVRALMVQRWYRNEVLWAVSRMQGLCRMMHAKKRSKIRRGAVNIIYAFIRGRKVRRLEKLYAAVVHVQNFYRRYMQKTDAGRNTWKARSLKCIFIQRIYRRHLAKRRYQRLLRDVIRLQADARGFLVRRSLRKKHRAALRIQALFRGRLGRWLVRQRLEAALFIQSAHRRHIAFKRAQKRRQALVPLQVILRSLVTRRRRAQPRQDAAIRIQAWIRMRFHRPGRLKDELGRRRAVAVCLQSFGRGFVVRSRLRYKHRMARRIQQMVRYRRFVKVMGFYRHAALTIQRYRRGTVARWLLRRRLKNLKRIPALAKLFLWRKRHFARLNKAAADIQRIRQGTFGREYVIQSMMSAIQLQTWWRGCRDRLRWRKIKRLKGILLMMVYRRRYVILRRGYLCLRAGITRSIHEKMPRFRRDRLNRAALVLQRSQRGAACRRRLQRRAAAMAKIQALVRRVIARTTGERATSKKLTALAKIQARCHGIRDRREFSRKVKRIILLQYFIKSRLTCKEYKVIRAAAVAIQRMFQGVRLRRRFAARKQACVILQRFFRGAMAYHRYTHVGPAVRKIQRAARAWLSNTALRRRHVAATKIEAWWRSRSMRWRHVTKCRAGDVLVRAAWMWKHMHLRRQRRQAAVRISSCWRGYCTRRNIYMVKQSTKRIRAWWANIKCMQAATETVQELIYVRRKCFEAYQYGFLLKIQRAVHFWYARKMGFRRFRRALVTLQSHFRRRRAAREVQELRFLTGPNVRRLPSKLVALVPDSRKRLTKYRGFKKGERWTKYTAKLVILKVLRGTIIQDLAERVAPLQGFVRWRKRLKQIILMQALARGFLTRRRSHRRRRAALPLQAAARGLLGRQRMRRRRAALLRLQAWSRGCLVRRRLRPAAESPAVEEAAATAEVAAEGEAPTGTLAEAAGDASQR